MAVEDFEEKCIMSTLENSTLHITDPQNETESIFDDMLTGLNTEELQNWEDFTGSFRMA